MPFIKVKGVKLDPNRKKYQHLQEPGIYDDDECCGSTRHIARMPDGTLFDLGEAERTISLVHIHEEGKDTGKHIPISKVVITLTPYSRL